MNEAKIELMVNTYDELGRLSSQSIHNGVGTAQFLYNIHGQLTQNSQFGYKEKLYYNTTNDIVGGNNRYYNGNISSILWSYGALDYDGPQVGNGYHYTYDSSNRLSNAQAIMYRSLRTDRKHCESFAYDLNGNIMSLQRDDMDDIEIRYTGNHLLFAEDYGNTRNQNGRKEFHGTIGRAPIAYTYDANGNLTRDLNRSISEIRYNILNLPSEITFTNGNKILHYYDASGARYHTSTITNQATATLIASKMSSDEPSTSSSAYQTHQYFIGNCVYWQLPTGQIVLNKVLNSQGYIGLPDEDLTYNYFAKDYQGNVKEVYSIAGANATTARCIQRMQYYPSGLPWEDNFGANAQPYKYGSKEFVEMHSLDEYDSEARWYYPAIMRTTTMDPLSEKYYSTSPYAWCNNNPVNLVDPDGEAVYYSYNGHLLGTDGDGFSGSVFITTPELFEYYKDMSGVSAGTDLTPLQSASLSAEAYAKIYTNILVSSDFNIDELRNLSISVYGDATDNYNNAEELNPNELASSTIFATPSTITVNQQSEFVYLLNTVENIQNAIGSHELDGHSILKYRDSTKTHHLAYLYQRLHPSWINTTDDFKKIMMQQYFYYLQKEKP